MLAASLQVRVILTWATRAGASMLARAALSWALVKRSLSEPMRWHWSPGNLNAAAMSKATTSRSGASTATTHGNNTEYPSGSSNGSIRTDRVLTANGYPDLRSRRTFCGQFCGLSRRKPGGYVLAALVFPRRCGLFRWLGCRDSNPNYLIQSQASYR
jgi:hypothetical protein